MFGAASPFGAAAPAQFGAPGGFGAPQPSPSFGGGAFGAPATTPNSFAAKPPASPFVAAPAPGGFGAAGAATSFGFAQKPAPGAFASPTPFGAPAPAPGAGLAFGAAPGTSPFGAAQPAATTFGASGFGASQPSSAFGTTTTFGAGGGFGAAKPAFPSPAPAPAAPFGAAAAPAAPFSFGGAGVGAGMFKSPTAATSPFGAAAPQPAPFGAPAPGAPGASPFGGAASFGGAATPGFGGGAFGMQAQTAGTGAPPFQVTKEADAAAQASGKASQMNYFSITNMPQYAHKSFEELRFEDYSKGNKGSSNGAPMSGFGAQAAAPAPAYGLPTTAFGAPATASPFGAAPAPAFGAAAPTPAPAFGATSTGFGQPGALAPAQFGAPAPAAGASNFSFGGFGGAQPAASAPFGAPASTSLFSATSTKLATPAFGAPPAANNLGFGATSPFGAAAPAAPKPGLFGAAPAPTASPFGAAAFGVAAPAPAAAAPGTSLFGATTLGGANAFSTTAPPAAAPAAFSFGGTPSAAAPTLSTFAPAPAPQSSFGGFGNLSAPTAPAPAPGVFGGFGGSTFGKPATAPAFGGAATPGTGLFGAPSFASPAAAPGFGGVTGATGLLGAASAVGPLVASHNQDAFGAHGSQVGMGAVASGVSSLEQRGLEIRLDGESLPNAAAKGLSEAEAAAAAAGDGGGSSLGATMQTFRHTPRTAARIRPRGYARPTASGADLDQQLALRVDPASSSHDAQLLSPESYLSHSHRRLVIDPNPRSRHGTDKHTGTAATTHDSRQTPAKPSRLFDEASSASRGRSPFTPGSAHRSDARTPEHTPSVHAVASAAGSSSMHKPTPKKTPGQFTPGFSRAQDDDIDEWQPPPPVDKHNENEPGDAVRTYDSYREYDKDRRALGDVDDNAGTTLAAMSASAPNPNAPILSRAQYVCNPPIVELQRLDDRRLEAVENFEVRRVGYGKIQWEGAVDLLGVNLDTDVLICENENGKPEVAVYHDRDDRKPARGEKLNRPAVITLEKVHAGNGASLAEQQQFAERIDRRTQKMGCQLISYDETTASWAFRTEGF